MHVEYNMICPLLGTSMNGNDDRANSTTRANMPPTIMLWEHRSQISQAGLKKTRDAMNGRTQAGRVKRLMRKRH